MNKVQWDHSNTDTNGPEESVLYSEISEVEMYATCGRKCGGVGEMCPV